MFRRHLAAVITFPLGIVALGFPLMCLPLVLKFESAFKVFCTLYAPAVIGCVLIAQTLALYRRTEPRRKVEWSVLAPVLAASAIIAGHWNNIVTQWINIPFLPGITVRWVAATILSIAFLAGICFLGAALAAWWMNRRATTGRPKGFGHEVAAVAILTVLTQGFLEGAHQIAWRIKATPVHDLDAFSAQGALCRGGVLLGLLAAWLVIALVAWRGADRLSRWRLISLFSVWVCLNTWIGDLRWALPQIRPYEWTWAVIIGGTAGILTILYAHLVVGSLWRRVFEPGIQPS